MAGAFVSSSGRWPAVALSIYAAFLRHLAARLLGWADGMRNEMNELRPRIEQKDIDEVVAACTSALGKSSYADEHEIGRGMTLDKAVELALNAQSLLS
jgi:hypothetical protein